MMLIDWMMMFGAMFVAMVRMLPVMMMEMMP